MPAVLPASVASVEITPTLFRRIAEILYRECGIQLRDGKEALVSARLSKRVQAVGESSFAKYVQKVENDTSGRELAIMIDLLTTNKTSFFRERAHFDFMQDVMLPEMSRGPGPWRLWSAGCSTGEEPYTLAMVLAEATNGFESRDVKILATDISPSVLAVASKGQYATQHVDGIPPRLLERYFDREGDHFKAGPQIRDVISFAKLNLMRPWPMTGPFDAIFCRNVMIYFDRETQQRLASRYAELLSTDGYLFIGHSESLAHTVNSLKFVQPAVYRKRS